MSKQSCWVFVDKDGTEKISNNTPMRRQFKGSRILSVLWGNCTGRYSKNNWNKWCDGWSSDEKDFLPFMGVILPKGTIEKIIGRKITWEDEAVEVSDTVSTLNPTQIIQEGKDPEN
jgi:hypothetical protein